MTFYSMSFASTAMDDICCNSDIKELFLQCLAKADRRRQDVKYRQIIGLISEYITDSGDSRKLVLEITKMEAEKMQRDQKQSIARTQELLELTNKYGTVDIKYYDQDMTCKMQESYYYGETLSRDSGPAVIEYDSDGKVTSETWYLYGTKTKQRERLSRDGERVTYYKDDKLHRVDGPAEIYSGHGYLRSCDRIEIWYLNGEFHRDNGPSNISSKYIDGKWVVVSENYMNNGQNHRADGPSEITYRDNGTIATETYMTNGKYRQGAPCHITYHDILGSKIATEHWKTAGGHTPEGLAERGYDIYGNETYKVVCGRVTSRIRHAGNTTSEHTRITGVVCKKADGIYLAGKPIEHSTDLTYCGFDLLGEGRGFSLASYD